MSRKQQLINIILSSIEELNQLQGDKGGSLFLNGDQEDNIVHMSSKGNPNVLNASFCAQMDNREGFNRFMLSMFGSYLVNNPEQKAKFIQNINIVKDFGVN